MERANSADALAYTQSFLDVVLVANGNDLQLWADMDLAATDAIDQLRGVLP